MEEQFDEQLEEPLEYSFERSNTEIKVEPLKPITSVERRKWNSLLVNDPKEKARQILTAKFGAI